MTNAYVVTATLTGGNVLTLDEPLPVAEGKVRVVVEPITRSNSIGLRAALEHAWDEQRRMGHVPPSAEEVQAYIQRERDGWRDSE
jgi:molybdopterin biosynthesis enzyme